MALAAVILISAFFGVLLYRVLRSNAKRCFDF
jgi:hypothetical protein